MKYRKPFKPRRYIVSKEMLERWRSQRLSLEAIAAKYGCDKTTVRNWLVQWKMPTELEPSIGPLDGLNRLVSQCASSDKPDRTQAHD